MKLFIAIWQAQHRQRFAQGPLTGKVTYGDDVSAAVGEGLAVVAAPACGRIGMELAVGKVPFKGIEFHQPLDERSLVAVEVEKVGWS